MLGLGKRFKVLNTHIESDLGGKIMFQGMHRTTAESIKSLQGYRIALVEAQNPASVLLIFYVLLCGGGG